MTVTGNELIDWVARELRAGAGFSEEEARRAAAHCCSEHAGIGVAATAVAVARGTTLVPEGKGWWTERLKEHVISGNPAEAEVRLGEAIAEPAPDAWDSNWPDGKTFRVVPIPPGLTVGDTFVVGDGMGSRATMKIVDHDGVVGVVIQETANVIGELWRSAYDEAMALHAT